MAALWHISWRFFKLQAGSHDYHAMRATAPSALPCVHDPSSYHSPLATFSTENALRAPFGPADRLRLAEPSGGTFSVACMLRTPCNLLRTELGTQRASQNTKKKCPRASRSALGLLEKLKRQASGKEVFCVQSPHHSFTLAQESDGLGPAGRALAALRLKNVRWSLVSAHGKRWAVHQEPDVDR